MKNTFVFFWIVAGGFLNARATGSDAPIALVPQPLQMERKTGEFVLKNNTVILVDLEAGPDGVVIVAEGGPGLFYGMQTLLQRHFFNKKELMNFIALMAQHKLNMLQLHLTDDQGWRVEIKRYPKLTQVVAWRKDIGFGLNPKDGTAYGPDGRYGGFYTQDDICELVAYAKARYITLVPEIEMPSHSGAARRAYPECGCKGGPHAFCAGNDETFTFLENVLRKVTWTDPKLKNWEYFKKRLDAHLKRLKVQKVNYRQPDKNPGKSK